MIKTSNIDKYFNKGKNNEIHVIDKTSLEFPKEGLVSLVGQSGSGKTTLLNVISGLDKATGVIEFDDKIIDGYKSNVWDKIRAHDIGFVFQNYYLLEDRSVYENIEITLHMIGIVDPEEVEYRIHYVLDAVGMFRYRKKRASDLSGGQKQRVAIARAIAKNPKVIIADEPTGNLDSTNSIEVMKIIKKISEERLVILVTHETQLAHKYSDRIITLTDGKVSDDRFNQDSMSTKLSFDDRNIYLGNLNKHSDSANVEIYSNSKDNDIKLKVIKINNNYYLQSSDENIKFNIVTPKSGIKIINDTKENVEENQAYETEFSLDALEKIKSVRIKKRTLSFRDSVIAAFRKVTNLGRKSKFQIFALLLLGIMFSIGVHTLFSSLIFDESKIYTDTNIYVNSFSNPNKFMEDDENNYIYYEGYQLANSLNIKLNNDNIRLRVESILPLGAVKPSNNLTGGRYPENIYEIVVDETLLDKKYDNEYMFAMTGINKKTDLLNQKLVMHTQWIVVELTIVGLTKTGTKGIYLDNDLLFSLADQRFAVVEEIEPITNEPVINRYGSIILPLSQTTVIEGRLPAEAAVGDKYETIVDIKFKDKLPLLSEITIFGDSNLKTDVIVVGYYDSGDNENLVLQISKTKYHQAKYEFFTINDRQMSVYSVDGTNPNTTLFSNLREKRITNAKEEQSDAITQSITQMIIALAVSGLVFYFLVRSSITSRVKEISILRSLGISKNEVISMYSLEYLILTAFTSLIGVLIGTIISNSIGNSFLGGFMKLRATPLSMLAAIILIFVSNVLIALIPVIMLLRKTPAQMLTSYDI